MKVFNIQFRFRNSTHIANVYFSNAVDGYTIYFTDVELILEFGGKASYNKTQGLKFLKSGKDFEMLKTIIMNQIEQLTTAA
jgi:hypothetical protein